MDLPPLIAVALVQVVLVPEIRTQVELAEPVYLSGDWILQVVVVDGQVEQVQQHLVVVLLDPEQVQELTTEIRALMELVVVAAVVKKVVLA
jgi:hypothetical protein